MGGAIRRGDDLEWRAATVVLLQDGEDFFEVRSPVGKDVVDGGYQLDAPFFSHPSHTPNR